MGVEEVRSLLSLIMVSHYLPYYTILPHFYFHTYLSFLLIFIILLHTMRLLKSNSLLGLVNSYVVDSPQPANLSYAWNFGSLLATCLGIQIVTGIILAIVMCSY